VDGISLDGLPRPAPPPPSVWLAAASRISASSGRRTSAREAHPAGEAHPPAKELRDLPAKLVFLHFFSLSLQNWSSGSPLSRMRIPRSSMEVAHYAFDGLLLQH